MARETEGVSAAYAAAAGMRARCVWPSCARLELAHGAYYCAGHIAECQASVQQLAAATSATFEMREGEEDKGNDLHT